MKSMSIEFFVARAWRYVSLAALVFVLCWVYYGFPDWVAVHFDNQGHGDRSLPRSQFFYVIAGLTLLSNVLPLMMIKPILQLPNTAIQTLPIRKEWKQNREGFDETCSNWFIFLPAIVNSILVFSVKILGKLNDNQYHASLSDYQWLMSASLLIVLVWLLYLPLKLLLLKP